MAEKFVVECLFPAEAGNAPVKSYYDTLPRSTIKTLTDMQKIVEVGTKTIALKSDVMYMCTCDSLL